jgi:predicted ribosome quality control (RQC) complex YloA/Tae2 family protein
MIARYSQIKQQVEMISQTLIRPGHIQKIFSTSRYLCFQVRVPGKNISIYLGRGGGCEGLWLGDAIPSSFLRKRDRWLEWCRKNFSSSLILNVRMDSLDRGIVFETQKAGIIHSFYVSWVGRHCYFALHNSEDQTWFTSWSASQEGLPSFAIFDEVGRRQVEDRITNEDPIGISKLLEEELILAKRTAKPKQKIKSLKIKISKISGDLRKITQWKKMQETIEKVDPTIFETETHFVLADLKYKFPKALSSWQKRSWLFDQVKRLKDAEKLQQVRLIEAEAELKKLETKSEVTENLLTVIGPNWKQHEAEKKESKKAEQGDFQIHALDDCKIAIGLSAQGNDQMRKTWAKSDDWWVHAANGTSAHAIIKLEKSGIPNPNHLKLAAVLIAKQSGISATELEVISTAVKNVRGVSGTAGMVTYKKSKKLLCRLV